MFLIYGTYFLDYKCLLSAASRFISFSQGWPARGVTAGWLNSPVARTAGAPAEQVFTRDASLAENARVSRKKIDDPANGFERISEVVASASCSLRSVCAAARRSRPELSTVLKHEPKRRSGAAQSAVLVRHEGKEGAGGRRPLRKWSCLHEWKH